MWHVQEVTGDIASNLRLTHPIGALWLAVRDADDVFDDIYETWVHDSQVPHSSTISCARSAASQHAELCGPVLARRTLQVHVNMQLSAPMPGCHLSLIDAPQHRRDMTSALFDIDPVRRSLTAYLQWQAGKLGAGGGMLSPCDAQTAASRRAWSRQWAPCASSWPTRAPAPGRASSRSLRRTSCHDCTSGPPPQLQQAGVQSAPQKTPSSSTSAPV